MSAKGEAARAKLWGTDVTERMYHPQRVRARAAIAPLVPPTPVKHRRRKGGHRKAAGTIRRAGRVGFGSFMAGVGSLTHPTRRHR